MKTLSKLQTAAAFAWDFLNAFLFLEIVLGFAAALVWVLAGCP